VISLLTTSRKALAGALTAFLAPLAALFASEQEITWRVVVACVLSGALAGLGVWSVGNTDVYEPVGKHAAPDA
jgi:hypothetical protein